MTALQIMNIRKVHSYRQQGQFCFQWGFVHKTPLIFWRLAPLSRSTFNRIDGAVGGCNSTFSSSSNTQKAHDILPKPQAATSIISAPHFYQVKALEWSTGAALFRMQLHKECSVPRATRRGCVPWRIPKGSFTLQRGEFKQQQEQRYFPFQDCNRDTVSVLLFPLRDRGCKKHFHHSVKRMSCISFNVLHVSLSLSASFLHLNSC